MSSSWQPAIISTAGRAGVTLILNGSRSKKALRNEWDKLPDYGALAHLSAKKITELVDWCIQHYWLRIEYTYDGIPLLFHTSNGWARVKQIWVQRLLNLFGEWQTAASAGSVRAASAGSVRAVSPQLVWPHMEHINRQIKQMLLQDIAAQKRHDLVPVLRAWFPHEVRKVRRMINHTLQSLGERPLPH